MTTEKTRLELRLRRSGRPETAFSLSTGEHPEDGSAPAQEISATTRASLTKFPSADVTITLRGSQQDPWIRVPAIRRGDDIEIVVHAPERSPVLFQAFDGEVVGLRLKHAAAAVECELHCASPFYRLMNIVATADLSECRGIQAIVDHVGEALGARFGTIALATDPDPDARVHPFNGATLAMVLRHVIVAYDLSMDFSSGRNLRLQTQAEALDEQRRRGILTLAPEDILSFEVAR